MKCNKVLSIPNRTSLADNRCFVGSCEKCGKVTYYCDTIKKYMHCHCCKKGAVKEMFKVLLTYFKKNGKYYSEGFYDTECQDMIEVIEEVRNKRIINDLPGVCCADFIILIEVEVNINSTASSFNNYPHLLVL